MIKMITVISKVMLTKQNKRITFYIFKNYFEILYNRLSLIFNIKKNN